MGKYKYNPRELQDLEERFLDSEDPYGIESDIPFYLCDPSQKESENCAHENIHAESEN